MPPVKEYEAYIKKIWENGWLTNNGPMVQELEKKLKEYLGLSHLLYVTNGTVALQFAIKSLELSGEILTTPFSYVATTSSIVWEGCSPVFVDIDPKTLNMDPTLIEQSVTPDTSAILATHIFGNPCDIDAILKIAGKHDLKVIFDGAHCFGTKYRGNSVYNYGDICTASFHATKLFQTIEGGAVITRDTGIATRVDYMRNFGHDGPLEYNGLGINGKNSEFHAAMGLCNLKYADQILSERKEQSDFYNHLFAGISASIPTTDSESEVNHSYYPLIFENKKTVITVEEKLRSADIYPRRYFYPSLSKLSFVKHQETPVSDDISERVLCLPMYTGLKKTDQERISGIAGSVM